jgi:hypothetical protein
VLEAAGAAACGAVVLSGCGSPKSLHARVRRLGPVARADVSILNGLLDLEHQAIAAYTAGIPLLAPAAVPAARKFLEQELSHAGELSGLVKQAGGKARKPAPGYDLGHPTSSRQVLALLHRIERSQLAAYLHAIPRLQPARVRAAAAAILANDAQHVSILRLELGLPPIPAPLVSGEE